MAGSRKRRSKAIASRVMTELGEQEVEKAHKWSWLLFLFCLPQRSQHNRRRRKHRSKWTGALNESLGPWLIVDSDGSRRVVLTPYAQPEISRVPLPPQLRNRPRSMLLAQHPSEPRVMKRHSRLMASTKSTQDDEREQHSQGTSFAAVPAAANEPVKRLSSMSRRSLLARSIHSRSSSPMQRTRLQALQSHHLSSDLAAIDVIPSNIGSAQTLKDSTCQMSQTEKVLQIDREPPCLTEPQTVTGSSVLHQEETPLISAVPSVPATPSSLASPTTPMTRPQTALSEESRLSMASSKFSLNTFPLPPSQLPPLPPMPMRRSASEASLYPRSEASFYSRSSLAHSIRSSIMSRPQSIYRKAVKALPRDPQYFLDILDEHMDVPPPVPLKIRSASFRPTKMFNTSSTPAPLDPPPPVPSVPRTTTPRNLRIQTSFEEQPSPDWDVAWEDFETILDDWDDTRGFAERPLSHATVGSDFQSKSSVTGDYLHIVERIRSQSTSPVTSVSSGASTSPKDINKALPPPPISQLPELESDSSTEGDPWSPHSGSQPATPSLRTLLKKTPTKNGSQSSLSKAVMSPPRSHVHIAHCVFEPPPRNPAWKTKHQISSSLGSSAISPIPESARASHPIGKDYRRIVSYAPSSIGGSYDMARERHLEGATFIYTKSRTPPPTSSVIPGLEGGYF